LKDKMERTILKTTYYTEEQADAIKNFVKDNQDRLLKQFGAKYIAVEYREVRGGVVVDSDIDSITLNKRVYEAGYGPLIGRTIRQFTRKSAENVFAEKRELTEAVA